MKIKKILSLLLVAVILAFSVVSVNTEDKGIITEKYEFPITPADEEWSTYIDSSKLHLMLDIDRDITERMTTQALVETVFDYPYLIDIFAFGTLTDGIEEVRTRFTGLDELLSREDALECLGEKSRQFSALDSNDSKIIVNGAVCEYLIKYLKNEIPDPFASASLDSQSLD